MNAEAEAGMARTHRLFFAVRPDTTAAARATTQRQRIQDAYALRGGAVATERLHVTLHWLGDHAGELPTESIGAALAAGARIETGPFGVVFDRLVSLGRETRPGPVVLTGGTGLKALRAFQRALGAELTALGLGRWVRTAFRPHLTLFYPRPARYVTAEAIDGVAWEVDELLFIDSHVNEGEHEVLGRWPLSPRQARFAGW
ncbi:MAG: 2'-5' RNA ligase family protein [Piscinibacter sp.]